MDMKSRAFKSDYVQSTTNLSTLLAWEAMDGSTNTVTNTNGRWSYTGMKSSLQLFFRSKVTTP